MLTLHVPMLLALLGTALMAVVIFAPNRASVPVTVSFAPPPTPRELFERWESPSSEPWEPAAFEEPVEVPAPAAGTVAWPALVDPCASGCDAAVRLGLVEALGAVRTSWAEAVLRRALHDEPDPAVRAAVTSALAGMTG